MNIKFYPKTNSNEGDRGYSEEEIKRNLHWIYADIECPHCKKLQPVAATHYLGGPCIKCGKPTGGLASN